MKLCADITKIASTQSFHLRDLIGWYERYLASLDCYTWVASLQLVKPGPLLLGMYVKVTTQPFIFIVTSCSLSSTILPNSRAPPLKIFLRTILFIAAIFNIHIFLISILVYLVDFFETELN